MHLKLPAIAIYYHSFKSISGQGSEEHFYQLKKQLDTKGALFPPQELRVIYLLTINYCISRINAGASSFVRESYDLYKNGLERDIFLENGVLSRFTFSNVVTTGLNLKEYKWVEDFIRDYAILSLQRNVKILGIFARLSVRDNKHDYLKLMPRVLDFVKKRISLQEPAISEIGKFLKIFL